MWVMKLEIDSKTQFLGNIALKHKVSITGYILTHYKDNKNIYSISAGFMLGDENNKKQLINDLKKQPELINIDMNNDFAVIETKQPLIAEPLYNPKIIWVEPIIINHKIGKNIWHMASFDKNVLTNVYNMAKKHFSAKLVKFKKEKLTNISITSILPELTKKQRNALEIAINHGYYDYPKKIKLEKLAKIMGISYSTYQAHLKKAEGKVIPNIYRKL